MSTNQKPSHEERLREYDREMLRSTFASIFWSAIMEHRKKGKLTLQSIADKLGVNKSTVSRWFSNESQNWETDTIADIAGALDLELHVTAVERSNPAVIITASGPVYQNVVQTSTSNAAQRISAISQDAVKPKQVAKQSIDVTTPPGISPSEPWATFSSEAA